MKFLSPKSLFDFLYVSLSILMSFPIDIIMFDQYLPL